MPAPIAGDSFTFVGCSTTTTSVVVNKEDTLHKSSSNNEARKGKGKHYGSQTKNFLRCYLAASTKAVLITFNGSTIPAFSMSTYSPD